jgi:tetratricopeptide (TPR) repeat protein
MSATRFQPGEFLDGRIEIIKAIRGGVGEIYLCVERDSGQYVALKRLQTHYAAMPRFRDAFEREAQTWIDLGRHPNIVPCRFFQRFNNEPFLVLDWIFGPGGSEPDLGKRMRADRLQLRPAIQMAIDVCVGLVHAASRVPSIVHCDLKPANILIGSQNEALITDFGMAKSALEAGVSASDAASQSDDELNPGAGGTPRYMAPEQWTGSELDARTDVYALACIVFEALAGHAVYLGPTLADFRRQHLTAAIPALDRPGATAEEDSFNALIAQCLAKEKEARPTPSSLLSALTGIHLQLFGEPPLQRPFTSVPTARDFNNRAVTFRSLGRPTEAVALLQQALAIDPKYALGRTNLAGLLLSLERRDDALSEVNRAIDDAPSFTAAYVNRAAIYIDQGKLEEALSDYKHVIDRKEHLAVAHFSRAKIYRKTGRTEEALADLEAATRADPLNAEIWSEQGELLQKLGKLEDAIQSFSRAVAAGGGTAIAHLQRGLAYFGAGDDRLAADDATAAIAKDSKFRGAYLLRAHSLRNLWQSTLDFEKLSAAMQDYSRVIELDPARAYVAYIERGKILNDNHQEEAAIADFTSAIEIDPNRQDAYLERGRAYRDAQQYEEAIVDLERVLKLNADDYDTLLALGDAYRGAGRLANAIATYSQAIETHSNRPEAYVQRAETLRMLGRVREALRDADHAIELHPTGWAKPYQVRAAIHEALGNSKAAAEDTEKSFMAGARFTTVKLPQGAGAVVSGDTEDAQTPDPDGSVPEMAAGSAAAGQQELRMHAEALFSGGRYAEAAAAFDRLIKSGDASAAVYNRSGLAKVRAGRVQDGIEDYGRALVADPAFAAAYNNRGVALRSLGQSSAAVSDFDRAIEFDPDYAMAYVNRGGAYHEINENEQALADLTKGIDLNPNSAEGYADRAAVYGNLKRFPEAIADLQRALEINANYAGGHYTLGAILVNRGDLAEGLRSFERAAALGMKQAVEAVEMVRKELSGGSKDDHPATPRPRS